MIDDPWIETDEPILDMVFSEDSEDEYDFINLRRAASLDKWNIPKILRMEPYTKDEPPKRINLGQKPRIKPKRPFNLMELRENCNKYIAKLSKSPKPVLKYRMHFIRRQKKYKSNYDKRL